MFEEGSLFKWYNSGVEMTFAHTGNIYYTFTYINDIGVLDEVRLFKSHVDNLIINGELLFIESASQPILEESLFQL